MAVIELSTFQLPMPHIHPVHVPNFSGRLSRFLVSSFCIIINFCHVIIKKRENVIKKLMMMQKLDPRTAGLMPSKIEHVDTGQDK